MTKHILNTDSKSLQSLLVKVNQAKEFNHLLAQYLPAETMKHCQVVKYEKNCLFVIVENGNWATQLRFHIPNLIKQLRQCSGFENLSGIICKTRPSYHTSKNKYRARFLSILSEEVSKKILEIAESIRDSRLKKIIQKIAGHV